MHRFSRSHLMFVEFHNDTRNSDVESDFSIDFRVYYNIVKRVYFYDAILSSMHSNSTSNGRSWEKKNTNFVYTESKQTKKSNKDSESIASNWRDREAASAPIAVWMYCIPTTLRTKWRTAPSCAESRLQVNVTSVTSSILVLAESRSSHTNNKLTKFSTHIYFVF